MTIKQLIIYNMYFLGAFGQMIGLYLLIKEFPELKIAQRFRLVPLVSIIIMSVVIMWFALKAF